MRCESSIAEMPTEDELTWCIGPPLRASFVTLLGGEEYADRAVALYRERFSDIGLFENGVYRRHSRGADHARAVRPPAVRRDQQAACLCERIVAHFGLRRHFEHVFGSELDGTRVDKSDLLAYALKKTGVDPAQR